MLSRYTRRYSVADGVALYSTISGALAFIPGVAMEEPLEGASSLTLKKLKELRLVFDSPEEENVFVSESHRVMRREKDETLHITVEITTACNFRCKFCYQDKTIQSRTMTDAVEDAFISLLQRSDLSAFKEININFIGGEPLLFASRAISIWKRITALATPKGIVTSAKINTNGYCLEPTVAASFANSEFVIPFAAPNDYGTVVCRNTDCQDGLRSEIEERFLALTDVFRYRPDLRIVFRYNVNHDNVFYIKQFFEEVSGFGFPHYRIDVVNTNNATHSTFCNELSDDDFWRWYLSEVLPLCLQYSLPEPCKFRNELSRCKARRRCSFKLFADGRIGLCNGVDYTDSAPTIWDIATVNEIDAIYRDVKSFDYIDGGCRTCDKIFICGGDAICHPRNCQRIDARIDEYVIRKLELKYLE